jgi:hypothetical protein
MAANKPRIRPRVIDSNGNPGTGVVSGTVLVEGAGMVWVKACVELETRASVVVLLVGVVDTVCCVLVDVVERVVVGWALWEVREGSWVHSHVSGVVVRVTFLPASAWYAPPPR